MTNAFAEVIGDPIAQSLSPAIHRHWLAALRLSGDYRANRVAADDLADFLAARRSDPDWRGCNVTIPHKERILPLLERIEPAARAIGAVNIVWRDGGALTGENSDVAGVAAALEGIDLEGRDVAMIGAGGAARAAVSWLAEQRPASLTVLVRNPDRAEPLRALAGSTRLAARPLDDAVAAFTGAALVINASPLGMVGAAAMPTRVLDAARRLDPSATAFDMVAKPLETPFLAAAGDGGARTVDGLVMLVGQARRAFTLFFGAEPPSDDAALRAALARVSAGSGD